MFNITNHQGNANQKPWYELTLTGMTTIKKKNRKGKNKMPRM